MKFLFKFNLLIDKKKLFLIDRKKKRTQLADNVQLRWLSLLCIF